MQKQLTLFEFIRLLAALVLAVVAYEVSRAVALAFVPEDAGVFGFVAYLVLGLFLPALLSIVIACILPSWRYKTIAATILLVTTAFLSLVDMFFALGDLMALLATAIQLSASLSGALAGAWFWQTLKDRHSERTEMTAKAVVKAREQSEPTGTGESTGSEAVAAPAGGAAQPKVSTFLLGLSLAAIPATYLTLVASALLVVGYSALLLMLLFELPRIPTVVLIAAFLAPLVAAWASLRALWVIFFPKPPFQPAVELDLTAHPVTRATIDEVCAAVGTRAPDHIILHAEPTFFVTQQKLRVFAAEPAPAGGRAEVVLKGRTLAIGMPLLPLLSAQETKAVLAHEFAHFSGRDTLYSVWVGQIYRSLGESLVRLQRMRGTASGLLQGIMSLLILPSLLFLALFLAFFAAVDAIVSRARELRADWIAASRYGSAAVAGALQKVVQYGAHFSGWTDKIVREGTALEDPEGLYRQHRAALPQDAAVLQSYLDTAMDAVEHEYASHPTLRTRIANLPPTPAVAGATLDAAPLEKSNGDAGLDAGGTESRSTPPAADLANPIAAELVGDEARLSAAVSVSLEQIQALVAQQRAVQMQAPA